jgi:broad specificity phosphatase PhoE
VLAVPGRVVVGRAYPRPVIERLFVARHAETRCAQKGILNGDPTRPCPLTPRGREQAAALGSSLSTVPLDLCITTEFERTRSTGRIMVAGRGIPMVIEPLLNDPQLGALEGLAIDEHRRWMDEHDWTEAPEGGGESQLDALRRYVTGWTRVCERPEKCALVVAHAFTISFALTVESGDAPAIRRRYEQRVELAQLNEVDAARLSAGLQTAAAELAGLADAV